jgi:heme/copper-type cytochrome/quinol oxidase subunit 3
MSVSTAFVRAAPPLPPPAIVGTVLVIAADVMLFAGLLFAFWVLRLGVPVWPPPLQPRLPVGLTAANTLVLVASGLAIAAGIREGRHGGPRRARWLGAGAGLGALFVAVQGYEWIRLVGFGIAVTSGIYGALFYTLIGAHALHVVAALAWLAVTAAGARGAGAPGNAPALEACALYWQFVVALWPVLYVSLYFL